MLFVVSFTFLKNRFSPCHLLQAQTQLQVQNGKKPVQSYFIVTNSIRPLEGGVWGAGNRTDEMNQQACTDLVKGPVFPQNPLYSWGEVRDCNDRVRHLPHNKQFHLSHITQRQPSVQSLDLSHVTQTSAFSTVNNKPPHLSHITQMSAFSTGCQ